MLVRVARVAANTSTGNQDITTTDLGGATPSAVLFYVTRATVDGTAADHVVVGMGAATSTTERWALGSFSEHGLSATNTGRRGVTDACIWIIEENTASADGEADFVSFIPDGVRVNWSNAPAQANLITAVFFEGSDVSAHANTATPNGSSGGTLDVTDPGFEPDFVIFCSIGDTIDDTADSFYHPAMGFAVNDGADTQRFINHAEDDVQSVGDPSIRIDDNYGIGQTSASSGNLIWAGEIGTFDSSGFTITTRVGSTGGDEVAYLAIASDSNVWLGTHTSPTSTGNQSSSAPNFLPQALLVLGGHVSAVNTGYATSDAGTLGFSAITEDSQFSNAVSIEDGSGTTDTQSLSENRAIEYPDDDGTTGWEADFVEFTSTGWTLNWTAVKGAADQFIVLAIEDINSVSIGGSITPSGALTLEVDQTGLSGSITPSGVSTNSFLADVEIDGSITPTGTLSTNVTIVQELDGTIAPSGSVSFVVTKSFEGSITPSGLADIFTFTEIDEEKEADEYIYIEQVKYTEPYGLQITGSDDDRLKTSLADAGIKTTDEIDRETRTKFHERGRNIVTGIYSTNLTGIADSLYPPDGEGALVPLNGVIFWPPDAGEIPLGWQIYQPGQGRFLVGQDDPPTNFIHLSDGGQLTIDLSHSHGPGTLATDSDSHSHTAGSYVTDSDNHSHTSGSYVTDSDNHNHSVGTYAGDSGGSHSHGIGTIVTANSGGHAHDVGSFATVSTGLHNHTVTNNQTVQSGSGISVVATQSTNNNGLHSHTITGTSASISGHIHIMSGSTATASAHTHTVSGGSGSDSHSHDVTGISTSDSHSHGISGTSSSDAHSHNVDSGLTATVGDSSQSILPPYHVGTWIQFVGRNP